MCTMYEEIYGMRRKMTKREMPTELMLHSLERLIKVQKFKLFSIFNRFVLRKKMYVGLWVWWVLIEE